MGKLFLLLLLCLSSSAWADCNVSAFSEVAADSSRRPINVGGWPPLQTQSVSVSGVAAEPSSAWPVGTTYLIFKCTAKTYFAIGPIATVTATTGDLWVAADEFGYVGITTINDQISFIE